MQKYVLGFIFDSELNHVLLQKKNKPEFLSGKLNGIGGKLEEGEDPIFGMIRECKEETEQNIPKELWFESGYIAGDDFHVTVFFHVAEGPIYFSQIEDEELIVVNVNNIDKYILCDHVEDQIEIILEEDKSMILQAFDMERNPEKYKLEVEDR